MRDNNVMEEQTVIQGKFLPIITGVFVAILVLSTITSAKVFDLWGLYLPGGTVVFPILFIFNDILTEVYGYERSRRVVWTGLFGEVLTGIVLAIVGALPAAPFWHNQEAYQAVLGFVPRIAMAGVCAYFSGEMTNSYVISRMKYVEGGSRRFLKQGWRFLASTLAGEAVDSLVFMTLAFAGTIPPSDLIRTMVTLYVVKVLYEIVALPFSTRVANWIKDREQVDHIDRPESTNYNPFII